MKKGNSFIVAIMLCLALWGCNSQEGSQYDTSKNQVVSFQGIHFQVPEEWEKEFGDEEYLQYSEREKEQYKNCLAFTFEEEIDLEERAAEAIHTLRSLEAAEQGIEKIEQSKMEVDGRPGKLIEYTNVINGKKYKIKTILFQIGESWK